MSEYYEYMWDSTRSHMSPALARSIYEEGGKLDKRDKKLAINTVRAILRGMPAVGEKGFPFLQPEISTGINLCHLNIFRIKKSKVQGQMISLSRRSFLMENGMFQYEGKVYLSTFCQKSFTNSGRSRVPLLSH